LLIGFIAAFVLVRLPRQAHPEVVGEPVGGSEEGEYLGEEPRDEP
jgi:hypothetical protein